MKDVKIIADIKPRTSTYVRCDGKHITIDKSYEYNIAMDRCDTHAKIVAWVLHFSEKDWADAEIIHDFILCACKHNRLSDWLAV